MAMNQNTGFGLFLATFVSVFVAELGDKTQLATFALSADASSARSRAYVFVGASVALVTTSAIGVLAGASISRFISPALLQRAAGILFVVLGMWMLVSRRG